MEAAMNGSAVERKVERTKKPEKVVSVPKMDVRRLRVKIRSMDESPLLMQCFSEKSKTEMLERQMGIAKAGKEKRNPVSEFVNALWWMDPSKKPKKVDVEDDPNEIVKGQKFGVPARLFKSAIVDAGDKKLALPKTMLRGAFYVFGTLVGADRLVCINSIPTMDERNVRNASGTADVRFRGLFAEWSATLDIEYDSSAITDQQLLALISQAGWRQGVCDFRPASCGGDYGRWVIDA